jgi:hypothetical protein
MLGMSIISEIGTCMVSYHECQCVTLVQENSAYIAAKTTGAKRHFCPSCAADVPGQFFHCPCGFGAYDDHVHALANEYYYKTPLTAG